MSKKRARKKKKLMMVMMTMRMMRIKCKSKREQEGVFKRVQIARWPQPASSLGLLATKLLAAQA